MSVKQDLAKEVADRIYDQVLEKAERDFVEGYGRSRIDDMIASQFAERYVRENFDKLAAKIDIDSVVKMAQLRAVGKAMGER